jgi:hypothetical protein
MQLLGHGEKGAEVSQLHPGMISREELVVSESILDASAWRAFPDEGMSASNRGFALANGSMKPLPIPDPANL